MNTFYLLFILHHYYEAQPYNLLLSTYVNCSASSGSEDNG